MRWWALFIALVVAIVATAANSASVATNSGRLANNDEVDESFSVGESGAALLAASARRSISQKKKGALLRHEHSRQKLDLGVNSTKTSSLGIPFSIIGHFEDQEHGWSLNADAHILEDEEMKQYSGVRFTGDCKAMIASGGNIQKSIDTEIGVNYVVIFQASFAPVGLRHMSSEGYIEIDGDKRRFVTTAQCVFGHDHLEKATVSHNWDTFTYHFLAQEKKTVIQFGEVGPGQCVAVREVILGPKPPDNEAENKWKDTKMLMSALRRTGCPNPFPSTVEDFFWKLWRQKEGETLMHMWRLCNKVRMSSATEDEAFACCGLSMPCVPESCNVVTSVDPTYEMLQYLQWIDLKHANASQSSTEGARLVVKQTNLFADVKDGDAARAVDQNTEMEMRSRSCTATDPDDPHNPWWKVDLPTLQDIRAIRVTARNDSKAFANLMPFSVIVGNTQCASDVLIRIGETKEIPCLASGKSLKIQVQRPGVAMNLCEVQIQVTGSALGSSDSGCPLDLGHFGWHGNGDLYSGYLAGHDQYFESKQIFKRPISVFAEVKASVASGVNCFAVTLFAKDAFHSSGYALNWGDRMIDSTESFKGLNAISQRILSCETSSIEKIVTADEASVMVITAMLSRVKSGEVPVDMYVDDVLVKSVRSYTSDNAKAHALLHWIGSVGAGNHIVRIHTKTEKLWACPPDTGYVDVAFFGVRDAIRAHSEWDGDPEGNKVTGCPPSRDEDKPLLEKKVLYGSSGQLLVMVSLPRLAEGNPILKLKIDGKLVTKSSSFTKGNAWNQGYAFYSGAVNPGFHHVEVFGTDQAWGCANSSDRVGSLDVLQLEGMAGVRSYFVKSPAKKQISRAEPWILQKGFKLEGNGLVIVTASLLSSGKGARTLELWVNDRLQRSAPVHTEDMKDEVHAIGFIGHLPQGQNVIELRGDSRSTLWGINEDWGGLNIMTFEGPTERKPKEVLQFHPFKESKLLNDKMDTNWHSLRVDADSAGAVHFHMDGQLQKKFADHSKKEGPVRFVSSCQAMQVRNVHVSASDVCAVPTKSCVTRMDLPLGVGGTMWRGTAPDTGILGAEEVLESSMKFAPPVRVSAEMRSRSSGCLMMTVLGTSAQPRDGYGIGVYEKYYEIHPGRLVQDKKANTVRDLSEWHTLAIHAENDLVKYYLNDVLMLVLKDRVARIGPLRFIAWCQGAEVRNVVVTLGSQCWRDQSRMRPAWVDK